MAIATAPMTKISSIPKIAMAVLPGHTSDTDERDYLPDPISAGISEYRTFMMNVSV
jgi:hypothetical protein